MPGSKTAEGPKARVLCGDLPLAQQQEAINAAFLALEKGKNDQDAARMIKEDFEKKEPGAWHVAVGSEFGCEVTHEAGSLVMIEASIPLVRPAPD